MKTNYFIPTGKATSRDQIDHRIHDNYDKHTKNGITTFTSKGNINKIDHSSKPDKCDFMELIFTEDLTQVTANTIIGKLIQKENISSIFTKDLLNIAFTYHFSTDSLNSDLFIFNDGTAQYIVYGWGRPIRSSSIGHLKNKFN